MPKSLISNATRKNAVITIASSTTISSSVDCLGLVLAGFKLPANMEGTTITLEGSVDNGATFVQLRNDAGTAITYTFQTGAASVGIYYVAGSKETVQGLTNLRVIAGTAQTTEATVTIELIFVQPEG